MTTKTITKSNQIIDLSNEKLEKLVVKGNNLIIKNLKMNNLVSKAVQLVGNNITLINCSFSKCQDGEQFIQVKGMYNRISNCLFENFEKKGVIICVNITKSRPNFCMIDNNNFRDMKEGKGNGYEVIRIGDSKTSLYDCKTIILNNFFINCVREIELISVKSCKNVICWNKVIASTAITLRHGNDNVVENNYINGNHVEGCGGIRIMGSNHKIRYNTIESIYNDNPWRTALSIMSAEPNPKLNGYHQVKDCLITENDFLGCSVVFSLGVNNKRPNPQKPTGLTITNNNIVKCDEEVDLSDKCLGIEDSVFNNIISQDDNFKIDVKKYPNNVKEESNLSNEEDFDNLYFKFTHKVILPDVDEDEEKEDLVITDDEEVEDNFGDEFVDLFDEVDRVLDYVDNKEECLVCADLRKQMKQTKKLYQNLLEKEKKEKEKYLYFYNKMKEKLMVE